MAVFSVIWALVAIILVAVAIKMIPYRPIDLAVGALIWAVYRTFFVSVHVHWAFIRPLDMGWFVLVVVLLVAVYALGVVGQADYAQWAAWAAIAIAVLAPFVDMFGAPFWGGWLNEPAEVKIAMIIALAILAALAAWQVGVIPAVAIGGLAVVMAIAMAQAAVTGSAGPLPTTTTTTSASPAPTTGATPSATPSATATSATPSPSPTTPSASPSTPTAQAGKVIGWDDVLSVVEKANATSAWQQLIDDNQSKLGFGWKDASSWATTKTGDGNIAGARVVVIFGASASEISDSRARELAGVGTTVPVVRATSCYVDIADKGQVCPSGDVRVTTFIAPIGTENGELVLKTGSGIALVPSDGKVTPTPATYTVAS